MSSDEGDVERRALALVERLVARPRNARFRARLLKNESPSVLYRVAQLEGVADASNLMPTEVPEPTDKVADVPPERFGPFRIVSRIGSGGMGEVWLGQRDDGVFEQTVAIKLIQTHLQTRAGAAFETERRILAQLEHPHIARLIDGGVTGDGRPCLVMEYVDGLSFDEACASVPLATRLERLTQAAAAVHYAHCRLIAHGDLKPSNILVDKDGRVRLLDFGIARLISDKDNDGYLKGAVTSGFSSPSRLAGAPPSIQDDVFALGRLMDTIVGSQGDTDLVAIVAKATAHDEGLRYSSVTELTADIDRWRRGFPVSAQPPRLKYRARLFLRRNWKSVLAGIVLTVLAIFALAGLISVEREKAEAVARSDDARGIARYLLFTLYDQLETRPNSLSLRRDVARTAQYYLNRLANGHAPNAEVQIEAAQGLIRLAQVQGSPMAANLGEPTAARHNLQSAQTLLRDAGDKAPKWIIAKAYLDSAYLAEFVEDDRDLARQESQKALAALQASPDSKPEQLASYYVLDAVLEQWSQHYPASIVATQNAERALSATKSMEGLILRAKAIELRGDAIWYGGNPAGSVPAYRSSVEVLEETVRQFPDSMYALTRLGHARWALASALADTGAVQEGLVQIELSSRELRQVVAFDSDDDDARRHLHISENARGGILVQAGHVDQGLKLLADTARERKAIWQNHPGETRRMRDYAVELKPLADLEAENGRIADACVNWAEARRLFEQMDSLGRLSEQDRVDQLGDILKSERQFCS